VVFVSFYEIKNQFSFFHKEIYLRRFGVFIVIFSIFILKSVISFGFAPAPPTFVPNGGLNNNGAPPPFNDFEHEQV
jgi:hypothetical protein